MISSCNVVGENSNHFTKALLDWLIAISWMMLRKRGGAWGKLELYVAGAYQGGRRLAHAERATAKHGRGELAGPDLESRNLEQRAIEEGCCLAPLVWVRKAVSETADGVKQRGYHTSLQWRFYITFALQPHWKFHANLISGLSVINTVITLLLLIGREQCSWRICGHRRQTLKIISWSGWQVGWLARALGPRLRSWGIALPPQQRRFKTSRYLDNRQWSHLI